MSNDPQREDLDERVSSNEQISLTRRPELSHALVTGPFPYSRSEQEAWLDAAKTAVRQHQQDCELMLLVAWVAGMASACDGELTIALDGDDLLIQADDFDGCLRVGIRDGEPYVVED